MRKVGVMLEFPPGATITVDDVSEALRSAGRYIREHGNVNDVDLVHPLSQITVRIRKQGIA